MQEIFSAIFVFIMPRDLKYECSFGFRMDFKKVAVQSSQDLIKIPLRVQCKLKGEVGSGRF